MGRPKSVILSRAVSAEPVQESTDYKLIKEVLDKHVNDKDSHVDSNVKDSIKNTIQAVESHTSKDDIHVTVDEKAVWNAKETPQGAQSKVNKVMSSLESHTNNRAIHLTQAEKDILKDKYTKAETRNLLKHALTGMNFLPAVNTRTELSIKYPKPEFNSVVYVRAEKVSLIYTGEYWLDINIVLTPEVTDEIDGLMHSEDKQKLDGIEANANNYIHPDDIDTKHVSMAQIDYWNDKADNLPVTTFNDGLMIKEDKKKLNAIEENANNYTHPENHEPSIIIQDKDNRFVTDEQIKSWDNKIEKEYVDKTSNNILSTAKAFIESKISGIFNANESQLEILRTLSFELKKDELVKKFFDLFNSCTKKEEFQEHALNNNIHMSRNDISLLNNVKSLLEAGVNPDMEETDSSSPAYIKNKPTALPANGGNADTVGGYKAKDLVNNRSFYDYTIGTSEYTEEEVSIIGTENVDTIFELLSKDKKTCSVLFKPGYYSLDKEFVIKASNKVISGIGDISRLLGASIKIVGDNNIIENICFTNSDDTIVNKTAIIVEGNNNIISNNTIRKYNKGIVVEGNNNTITNNTLLGIRNEAIELVSDLNANFGNIVEKNEITYSNIGVCINSTKLLSKNYITKNNILNNSVGIVLSNKNNDINKTVMNIISENIVVRGNGSESDYLPAHKTIVSEFASKNIINSNITSGKKIISNNDVLSNNIS